jgi:hypothetical protein
MCTELGLILRLPLAAGSQDKEDHTATSSIRHTWASAAKAVRVHMGREQQSQDCPRRIGHVKPVVVRFFGWCRRARL